MPPYRDLLVAGISTQLDKEVEGFDEVISLDDDDFGSTGLRTNSLVRLGFLAVLPSKEIIGTIGSLSSTRHRKLLETLSNYLIQRERGSLKGKGLMKALMAEKKRERDL